MNKQSHYHDFSINAIHKDELLFKNALGWNGSNIDVVPFYALFNQAKLSFSTLKNIKLYDSVCLNKETHDYYLVIPFKVKHTINIEFKDDLDESIQQYLLNYALLKFICIEHSLFICPEAIPAIEKNDFHFFDSLLDLIEDLQGIIIDHYYLKNFDTFDRLIDDSSETFDCERIAYICFRNKYTLTIDNSNKELRSKFSKKTKVILPCMERCKQMNNIQYIESIIKKLPKKRPDPYKGGLSVKANNSESCIDIWNSITSMKSTSKKKVNYK